MSVISSVYMNKKSMLKMEKLQAKLLKPSIGVHYFCKSYPILKALNISQIDRNSRARKFYIHLIKQHVSGEMICHKDLISRVKLTCEMYGISSLKYIFDDSFSRVAENNFM